MREWISPKQVDVPGELRSVVGGHPLVARLLAQRGFTDPVLAQAFLDPARYQPSKARSLAGIEQACELITRAIAAGERLRIWGDFDVDGQTSTALLYETLSLLGARVDYALPLRREGHGLASRTISEARADNIKLLITCDTGISDTLYVRQAVQAGIQVIVTDHHDLPDELPPAACIVNPKLHPALHPCYHLTGVGVAYMLARALLEGSPLQSHLAQMQDLTAIGLIADVAYQVDDVRYLVQVGLQAARTSQRPGLRALMSFAELEPGHISEDDIGFQLVPRLNAAGRLADAELALRLLLAADSETAQSLAGQLEVLNRDRQALTEATMAAVERRLQQEPELARQPILILDAEGWEEGILGLVASGLVQRYQRPAIIIAHRESGFSVGSARSMKGIDIHQAIASQVRLLAGQGGHPMAAGFTMPRDNTAQFRQGILTWMNSQQPVSQPADALAIDAQVPWAEINQHLARELRRLAPFGPGNEKPLLTSDGAIMLRSEDVSRRSPTRHRRLICSDAAGHQLPFVWFNAVNEQMPEPGQALQVAFTLQPNYWKGRERLSLQLIDWRPHVTATVVQAASLVAEMELIDWRHSEDRQPLLTRLCDEFGSRLAIWAEGLDPAPEGSRTRSQLTTLQQAPTALAVLTPPPGADVFERLLACLRPQVLVLLPPIWPSEPSPQEFIALVLGMVRASLADPARRGRLETERMAARLGTRAEAVMAALRGLEANQVISLYESDDSLWSVETCRPPRQDMVFDEVLPDNKQARQQAAEQAKSALLYQLREARAYRQAYQVIDPRALLAIDDEFSATTRNE